MREGSPSTASEPTSVLLVDDDDAVREMIDLVLAREGYAVTQASRGEEALERLGERSFDVVLTDVRMPGMGGLELVERVAARDPQCTILVMSAFGSVELALDALRRGAYDYVSKPFNPDEVVLALRKARERERLRQENAELRARLRGLEAPDEQLGELLVGSEAMRRVAWTVRKVAPFRTTVLVLGESGVGKELVCRAIHDLSHRRDRPFVAVNCAAIPDALLESELFGHVRGAFTDAVADKRGLFEEAEGGTLLLDEVGELPVALQVKLLRVLQEEEVRRVGDNRPRKVDVRVLAATSRPLEQMVAEGSFRHDLFYRLEVMTVAIPPLRERREEIPRLCAHMLARSNRRLGTAVSAIEAEAMRCLVAYDWPGNVRELENTLEHAAVMTDSTSIALEHLPDRIRGGRAGSQAAGGRPDGAAPHERGVGAATADDDDLSLKRATRELERDFILRALARTGGNRTHAARLLELSPRGLLYKLKALGID